MKRLILLLTIALLVVGSSLYAQPRNGMRANQNKGYDIRENRAGFHDGSYFYFERMGKKLNLTDEQVTKINNLTFEHQSLAIDLKGKIQKNRLITRKMMEDNKIDKTKLLKITDENNELLGKIKLSKTNMWLNVYNLLDDTQKVGWTKTLVKFSSKGKEFHKQRRNCNYDCQRGPNNRMK